jgi:hypothetical protein
MSSLAAAPANAHDADEWQFIDSPQPYEGTKFQIDLIRAELSRRAGPSAPVRHFTVHPGVVYTSIDAALVGNFMSQLKVIVFYLVRHSFIPSHYTANSSGVPCFCFCSVTRASVGPVVWFFAPQYLKLEWGCRYSPRLPCPTCIHSYLSVCCGGTRCGGQGTRRGLTPGVPAFRNGSHGTQRCCSSAVL